MSLDPADLVPHAEGAPAQQRPVSEVDHVAPKLKRKAFHCMHCNVLAQQAWRRLQLTGERGKTFSSDVWQCDCGNCRQPSYWREYRVLVGESDLKTVGDILFPVSTRAPRPHPDLPERLRGDFEEARAICGRSPRGAAALLRLVLQKLMVDLGRKGEKINEDIRELVALGLPVGVQQALDALRVIGNNAVHPGAMDLQDDPATVEALFGLVNYIVEREISEPAKLQAMYDSLPPGALEQIQRRDGSPES